MFNNKLKKRVAELEKVIEYLEEQIDNIPSIEKDYFTKNVHYSEDMVCIKGSEQYNVRRFLINYTSIETRDKNFYFLKGTEPKCDFIKEDTKGNLEFIKNGVVCDKKGKINN